MPAWLDKIRGAITRKPAAGSTEAAEINAAAREAVADRQVAAPPTTTPLSTGETLYRLAPVCAFGAGLLLTIFAERLGNWAVLGFLLFVGAPIAYLLQRIERRIIELIDATKSKKR